MKPLKILDQLVNATSVILICAIIIVLGIIGYLYLASKKKPPAEAQLKERALKVDAIQVYPEDVPVMITGYGEVQSIKVVSIAPEVAGKIEGIHPRLEIGEIIPEGEILFQVDPRNYQAQYDDSQAKVEALKTSIQRLKKQKAIDQERVKTLKRSETLARAEFDRIQLLFEKDQVGTQSGVDAVERAYNAAVDQTDLLEQALELYPIQIQEAENNLASAQAMKKLAKINLDRCTVRAPFDARIKQVSLEKDQYVSPGINVLTLADDSILEIHVPLDSRDARRWLSFEEEPTAENNAWFNELKPVDCQIHWLEAIDRQVWNGHLDRVVKFEQETRTLIVAIRIQSEPASSGNPDNFPIVEGMFCDVEIPGKVMKNVFRLPHWAVSFKNTVYTSVDNRLVTVPVEVARTQDEDTLISSGVKEGDIVITTRLIDPLESTLLQPSLPEAKEAQS